MAAAAERDANSGKFPVMAFEETSLTSVPSNKVLHNNMF